MANKENNIKVAPQEMNCSFGQSDCNEVATVRVHYEKGEKARELCNDHYNLKSEDGLKYYQIGTTQIEVLI